MAVGSLSVYHIAIVTEGWLRGVAGENVQTFPTESEVATVDDAQEVLDRAYRILDRTLPSLTPEVLSTPRTFSGRGRTSCCRRGPSSGTSSTTRPTTAVRSRPSSSDWVSMRR